MKKLLNTLYITNPDRYLSLDGLNVVIKAEDNEIGRVPLHNLEAIVTVGYTGASPALMGACAKNNISLCFLTTSGRFLARVCGETRGNVTLRKQQYSISEKELDCTQISQNIIIGKIFNSRGIIERGCRDYANRLDIEKLKAKSANLTNSISLIRNTKDTAQLRGIEGGAAMVYFSCFDDLILQQKDAFYFHTRSKRPPLDNVNAMLSFGYTLLTSMYTAALEAVGLDPYVGFLHKDRPGRASLSLDIMEELRSVYVDRFVLTVINKKIITEKDFFQKENGSVVMTDGARKTFLTQWQSRKQEEITHPYLQEKVEWGVVPYIQALLLARYIRGDLDAYPPFLWK